MTDEHVLCKGLVERIGISGSRLVQRGRGGGSAVLISEIADHASAVRLVLDMLLDSDAGVLNGLEELAAVGHRVVHGGENINGPALADEKVMCEIEACARLAPLHNRASLLGIRAIRGILPEIPNVAVFDTSFHQTMPPKAYMYGIPYRYYEEDGIRSYCFHGVSHAYVARRAAEILERPLTSLKLVTCHLGNGSSVTAVDGGKSVDCSLGMSTTKGLIMGTRCGDIDASVVLYLIEKEGGAAAVSDILHKQSGLLGISGVSSDLRDVQAEAEKGNFRARLACEMLSTGIKKCVGSFAALMGGIDAVVFTVGIGENSAAVRRDSLENLDFLGVRVDARKNEATCGKEAVISEDGSKVKVMVVPTNEELMIARDTLALTRELTKLNDGAKKAVNI